MKAATMGWILICAALSIIWFGIGFGLGWLIRGVG